MRLDAIILTRNEEWDLAQCLESLGGVVSAIYVVDCGSNDRTCDIAHEMGAQVFRHEFVNYATQMNWALANVPCEAEWVLRIDADERLSPELRAELQDRLAEPPSDVTGFLFPRVTEFLGKTIRWGDTYPVWLLRVWRRGLGRCEDAWMDEHIVLDRGRVERLHSNLIHEIPKTLTDWVAKHNWYASRECQDILHRTDRTITALSGQARAKRWLKSNIYLRSPLFFRAFLYWCYRYFLRLGFLDGRAGLIYHFLHAFWYRFLVDAKLYAKAAGRD